MTNIKFSLNTTYAESKVQQMWQQILIWNVQSAIESPWSCHYKQSLCNCKMSRCMTHFETLRVRRRVSPHAWPGEQQHNGRNVHNSVIRPVASKNRAVIHVQIWQMWLLSNLKIRTAARHTHVCPTGAERQEENWRFLCSETISLYITERDVKPWHIFYSIFFYHNNNARQAHSVTI